jgi:hypothetical protein
VRSLIDALADFIREDLKEMLLPIKQEVWTEDQPERAIEVHKYRMPSAEDAKDQVPYILLQMLNGEDLENESKVAIRAIIVTFNWDPEQGALSLLNIISKLRFDLQRTGVVGEMYELKKPFEWLIYPDETMPYHIAEISTTWSVPVIERDVPFLHWG